jgi:hypothetical protein
VTGIEVRWLRLDRLHTSSPGRGRPSIGELRTHVRAQLPGSMVPSAFVVLDDFFDLGGHSLISGEVPAAHQQNTCVSVRKESKCASSPYL